MRYLDVEFSDGIIKAYQLPQDYLLGRLSYQRIKWFIDVFNIANNYFEHDISTCFQLLNNAIKDEQLNMLPPIEKELITKKLSKAIGSIRALHRTALNCRISWDQNQNGYYKEKALKAVDLYREIGYKDFIDDMGYLPVLVLSKFLKALHCYCNERQILQQLELPADCFTCLSSEYKNSEEFTEDMFFKIKSCMKLVDDFLVRQAQAHHMNISKILLLSH